MKTCHSKPNPIDIDHKQMHGVHQRWRNEYALWHEELKLWQDQLELTRDNLAEVLAGLEAHAKRLEKHGASLTLYALEALEHEHATAEYQRRASGGRLAVLAGAHLAEIEHHSRLHDIHEQLKHLHHAIVARCALLVRAFSPGG